MKDRRSSEKKCSNECERTFFSALLCCLACGNEKHLPRWLGSSLPWWQTRSSQECRISCCLSFGSILVIYLALWNFTALNQAKHLNGKNFRPISRSLSQSKPCCFRDGHMTQKTPIRFYVHFFEKCPSPRVLDQRVYKLLDATVLLPLKDSLFENRTSKGRAKS